MTGGAYEPQVVRRPLLMAATAFCVGALFDRADPAWAVALLLIFAVLTVGMARRGRILAALALPAVFCAAGAVVTLFRLPATEDVSGKVDLAAGPVLIEGTVAEAPDWRDDGHRLTVDLVGTSTSPRADLMPAHGRVWLTVTGTAAPCGAPGATIRAWARVREYSDPGFPGGEGRRARAARQGVTLRGFVADPTFCLEVRPPPPGLRAALEGFRQTIQGRIRAVLPGQEGALVRALAIGDRSGISDDTRRAFQRSGLAHVLAVSGLHLAVVCGLLVLALVAVFRRVPAVALGPGAHRTAALVALPVVALYTALVGAAPSAVRAALMVAALLVGHAFARLREAWSALALAVIVMVAWDPATLGDPGFQLSFASVAALLRIQPALADGLAPRRRSWRAWRRAPVEALLASVAATVGTTPLVLRHFGVLPVAGLLANLPAAPWASLVVVPLSLFGGLLAGVSPELAAPVLKLAGHAAGVLQAMAEHAAALPGAAVRLPQPTILECVLFYGATIGFSLPVNRGRGPRRLAWLSVLALALSLTVGLGARYFSKEVQITFLPVGQGDGAVVELPGGRAILVDTGPGGSGMDAAERVLLPFLRSRRIESLDAVVLTHAHADHTGSLATLAEQIPIREVWWTGDAREGPEWLPGLVAELGAREVAAGSEPYVAGPATVRFLGPVKDPRSYGDINDGSVVISVELGARRILMVGDTEAVAEQDLLQACAECLDADVLKAGHHGSRSSTTDAFLTAVSPEHAVLSCGLHNHFGFPHPEVVARLVAAGVRVWRTDLEGAIVVRTDGAALEVYSYEARRQRAVSPRADPPPAAPSTRPAP